MLENSTYNLPKLRNIQKLSERVGYKLVRRKRDYSILKLLLYDKVKIIIYVLLF